MSRPATAANTTKRLPMLCQKTLICKFNLKGRCTKGPRCNFAHSPEEMRALPNLQRTKFCEAMLMKGSCDDPKCQFAHARKELRRYPPREDPSLRQAPEAGAAEAPAAFRPHQVVLNLDEVIKEPVDFDAASTHLSESNGDYSLSRITTDDISNGDYSLSRLTTDDTLEQAAPAAASEGYMDPSGGFSRIVSGDDVDDPPFSRQVSGDDMYTPPFCRQVSGDGVYIPPFSRQVSGVDMYPPAFSRQVSGGDMGPPAFSRQVSGGDMGTPAFSRQVSGEDMYPPAFSRQVSGGDMGPPAFGRQVSDTVTMDLPSFSRLVSEPASFSRLISDPGPMTCTAFSRQVSDTAPPADAGQPKTKLVHRLRKTKMCSFFSEGSCKRGAKCNFAHDTQELKAKPELTCTKMCERLLKTGFCGDSRCSYAHSEDELRPEPVQPPPAHDDPPRAVLPRTQTFEIPACIIDVKNTFINVVAVDEDTEGAATVERRRSCSAPPRLAAAGARRPRPVDVSPSGGPALAAELRMCPSSPPCRKSRGRSGPVPELHVPTLAPVKMA